MQLIEKLDHALARLEQALIVFLFSTLIFLITFNIIGRNLFSTSFQKLLEVVPALVMWLALLGATLGLKHQRHIKLEVVLRHFNPAFVRLARSITNGCGALLMAVLFAASLTFVKNEIGIFGAWGWISVVFPLFFALAAWRFIIAAITTGTGTSPWPPPDNGPLDKGQNPADASEAS